ncbi:A24 family peptidase [Halocatena halophila]|uniref:A24 family peptidase n=1 Tax=Halocatena halophila TaxID=2814576 RepID=UPI002ED30250
MLDRALLWCQLLVGGCFVVAGWYDRRSRRVPDWLWYYALVPASAAFTLECVVGGQALFGRAQFVRGVSSVFLGSMLGFCYWRLGLFGGADAKAIAILSIAFPTTPVELHHALSVHPVVARPFVIAVVLNALLLSTWYPIALFAVNCWHRRVTTAMVVGKPCAIGTVCDRHGELLTVTDGWIPRPGVDLDALRWYLDYWELDLEVLRNAPNEHAPSVRGDRWGAKTVVGAVEGSLYGTSPEALRTALDRLTDGRDTVWITPGIPFVSVLAVGLIVTVVWGDLLALLGGIEVEIIPSHQLDFQFRAVVRRFLFGDA